MKELFISVIIPTYNNKNYLPRSIKSVLNQTFQNFEVIIIDDASTDNTEKVVKELQKKDKRLIYKKLIKNSGGAAKPKNIGIKMSKGKFIATIDSDDEWFPEKLEKQINLFNNSKVEKLGFVGCFAKCISKENNFNYSHKFPRYNNVLFHVLARDYMGSGSSMMYKREVFDNIGGFDEKLRTGQDSEMRIRLAQYYGFDFVEEELFIYYSHKDNISNSLDINQRMKDINYFIEKWKHLYKKQPKAYSDRLRFNGTSYMLAGEKIIARKSFLRSISLNYFNRKSYLYFLISLLGLKAYKKLCLIKAKNI